MTRGKAEDAGGLTPAKDDNAAPYHFDRRSLPIFKCVDYICRQAAFSDNFYLYPPKKYTAKLRLAFDAPAKQGR